MCSPQNSEPINGGLLWNQKREMRNEAPAGLGSARAFLKPELWTVKSETRIVRLDLHWESMAMNRFQWTCIEIEWKSTIYIEFSLEISDNPWFSRKAHWKYAEKDVVTLRITRNVTYINVSLHFHLRAGFMKSIENPLESIEIYYKSIKIR